MRMIVLAVSLLAAACTVRLPPAEPQHAPPPPPSRQEGSAAPPKATAAPQSAAKAAPVAKAPPAAAPKPAAAPAAAHASAPLDLRSLEQRLKDTEAIGVLTKLSLKNQVDDLISQFRAYHAGRRPPTLAELKQPFELLLMKVLALLQDKDAALARDINASRDAIWGVLADRDKLAGST